MSEESSLQRFTEAQERDYQAALTEIRNGRKQSHWMWYIFPQIQGLGFSATSKFYAIKDLHEAADYLNHPVLGKRLVEISAAILQLAGNNATSIFGNPDDLKLKSCMTLFAALPHTNPVFNLVLEKYFKGAKDSKTLQIINGQL